MAMVRYRVCGGGVLAITMEACGLVVSMVTLWEQSEEEEEQEGDDGDDWSDRLISIPQFNNQYSRNFEKTFAPTKDEKIEFHRLH